MFLIIVMEPNVDNIVHSNGKLDFVDCPLFNEQEMF